MTGTKLALRDLVVSADEAGEGLGNVIKEDLRSAILEALEGAQDIDDDFLEDLQHNVGAAVSSFNELRESLDPSIQRLREYREGIIEISGSIERNQ